MSDPVQAAPAAPAPAAPAAPQAVTAQPSVDNMSNVIESAPADTMSTSDPNKEAPAAPAPAGDPQPNPDDAPNGDPAQQPNPDGGEASAKTPEQELAESLTPEQIQELQAARQYQPGEVELDIYDDFGNLDTNKFAEFLKTNNQRVFEQAMKAGRAYSEAEKIENSSWSNLRTEYKDVLDGDQGPGLEKALRGMRVLDVTQGGDGNLGRLAKEFLGPLRQQAIKAQESTNRQVTDMQQLQVYKPDSATPSERPEADKMTQLREAVASGDRARANQLRHAIRKERIAANNSNVNT